MKKDTETITVRPTPHEALVTDAATVNTGSLPNVNSLPDVLRPDPPENESVVIAIARLITPDVTAEMDRLTRENAQLNERVDNQSELIELLKDEREVNSKHVAAIAAAEADGSSVLYVSPNVISWLKATVSEAKFGHVTPQLFAAAQSIEAQCDAITNA